MHRVAPVYYVVLVSSDFRCFLRFQSNIEWEERWSWEGVCKWWETRRGRRGKRERERNIEAKGEKNA